MLRERKRRLNIGGWRYIFVVAYQSPCRSRIILWWNSPIFEAPAFDRKWYSATPPKRGSAQPPPDADVTVNDMVGLCVSACISINPRFPTSPMVERALRLPSKWYIEQVFNSRSWLFHVSTFGKLETSSPKNKLWAPVSRNVWGISRQDLAPIR